MKILSFDVEDWFHLLDHPSTRGEQQWSQYPSRIDEGLDLILNLLNDAEQKATFFCLGWMAEKYPKQIRRISEAGHDIGSHSRMHQLVYHQNQDTFAEDLSSSVNTLEQLIGEKVRYYRAPGFSITRNTLWAFEALLEQGIEVDCSVFPTSRAHGGFPEFGVAGPAIIDFHGGSLKELPINTASVLGKSFVYSGGGYFRVLPYWMVRHFTRNSSYVMTYFHPRDFDANQPVLPNLSIGRRFKSYYGLSQTESKLRQWLQDFDFMDVAEAVDLVDWSQVKRVRLTS